MPALGPTLIQTPANTHNLVNFPKAKLTFPEFDTNNSRGWIRRFDKFFELYQVPSDLKMQYVAMHVKDKLDT